MSRVGVLGRERIRSLQPRPPVRCTKQTDLIVLHAAAAANTPPVRPLVSQQAPSPLPSASNSSLKFPTHQVLLSRAPLLGARLLRRPPFPWGRQSHPAVLRVAKSVPAGIVGTLDSAIKIPRRLGRHSHPGSAPGALRRLGSTPLRGCCSRLLFHRKDTACLSARLRAPGGTAGFTPPFSCLWPGRVARSQREAGEWVSAPCSVPWLRAHPGGLF